MYIRFARNIHGIVLVFPFAVSLQTCIFDSITVISYSLPINQMWPKDFVLSKAKYIVIDTVYYCVVLYGFRDIYLFIWPNLMRNWMALLLTSVQNKVDEPQPLTSAMAGQTAWKE